MRMDLQKITFDCLSLLEDVGAFIHLEMGKVRGDEVETKSRNSFVSYVDKEAESRLVKGLSAILPEAGFLTEEGMVAQRTGGLRWIVDPLDGTTNFLYGLPCFSISVALQREDELVLGIVHEINRREQFYAWQGSGTFLNGRQVRVRQTNALPEALLATGFPYYDYEWLDNYLELLRYLMKNTKGLRRFGSAAVDLAYVACGRFDAFFEYSLHPWDIAAGALLVHEAGGRVTDLRGEETYLTSGHIVASSTALYPDLQRQIDSQFWGKL